MAKPDLLIDYDEIDNICGDLDENQRELYESNSEINYDEKSSVACNANSQASCMSDPSSFTVRPAIADLGNNQPIALKINGEVVKNSQWDVILSNATGKEISQNYYNSSTPGWTYPSDISNVCYIVHQNMPGNSIGVIDTNGAVDQGHWVCIFPIGDNKYEVINYNPNGSKIVTHDQLTNLMCGQYELRWD